MIVKKLKNKCIQVLKKILNPAKQILNKRKVRNKTKYFCIGRNKTGTTSLKRAFEDLGFIVGDQATAEKLYDSYFFENEFLPIIKYCETAEVFQDVPFSHFATLEHIDKAYPGSKFILTIRDDAEQWYCSLIKFNAKHFGLGGRIPTAEDLKNATYVRKGYKYNTIKAHGTSDEDPYNKEIMIRHYEKHNASVIDYFKDRPDDLLVINLSEENAYRKFVEFLKVDSPYSAFPWENKTE